MSVIPSEIVEKPGIGSGAAERLSARLLHGPLAGALLLLAVAQLATWVPHYLTWPWWADHDVFATLALGWEGGLRPYHDLDGNNFPGTIYLFWAVGKAFGWGKTAPFYAFDASLIALLGVVLLVWSHRRFGRLLPGAAGYLTFLAYYLGLDYTQAAQRDWHAPFFAVAGILLSQAFPGRAGSFASAVGTGLALTIRPQVVLFWPAALMAVDEAGREKGKTRRVFALLGWFAVAAGIVGLALLPLARAGALGDFVRSIRMAGFGGSYYRNTPAKFAAELLKQFAFKDLALLAGIGLLIGRASSCDRKVAWTWAVAWASVALYKPMSPYPHAYLDHPRALVSSVVLAVLVELILQARAPATVKLVAVLLALSQGAVLKPAFSNPVMSRQALHWLAIGREPDIQPMGYRHHPSVLTSAEYQWKDLREVTDYLRQLPSKTRVANALWGVPALCGPTAKVPALPAESIAWLFMVKRDDEAEFASRLEATPDSVVVWSPSELGYNPRFGRSFDLKELEPAIRKLYEPAERFGVIEVWRRRPEGGGP